MTQRRPRQEEFVRGLRDDGFYTPEIKEHSLEKILLHNAYAARFTASMHKKWPQLAYIGLYSGAGRARLQKTGEIVETTALGVFRLQHPFTNYIFVDRDPACTGALEARVKTLGAQSKVSYLTGDTSELVPLVKRSLPSFGPGNGLLSFCFLDPFAADFRFDILRQLSNHRMDFLVLLMLGRDVRTNLARYRDDLSSTRIAELVDDPDWRAAFSDGTDKNIVTFLLARFDAAMVRQGYLSASEDLRRQITAAGTGVLQYVLVFYSKSTLGQQFWKDILTSAPAQGTLGL